MRITLNLATRPYADIRPALKRLRIAMAVLTVVAIGLGLGLHAFHQKAEAARATEQSVQKRIDAINRERQGYQDLMHQPANSLLLTQAAELNQLFDEKTFSWTLAMEDLETVLPGGVQVSALEPVREAKTGKITLHLRVVGPRDRAVDLVQNLERSRYFLHPSIVGESTESTGAPGERMEPVSASNRVNFDLLAEYNSAAPLEHRVKKKVTEKKPTADGVRAVKSAPPPRAVQPAGIQVAPRKGATGLPPTAANQKRPNVMFGSSSKPSPKSSSNPGGPR